MPQNEPPKKQNVGPGHAGDGVDPPEKPRAGDDPLIDAVVKAQESLKKAEAALASYQDGQKLKEALAKIVDDYDAERAELDFDQDQLEDYRKNEVNELREALTPVGVGKVGDVLKEVNGEIDHLDSRIGDRRRDLAALEGRLVTERAHVDRAKAEFEALKKPAASIKDRLKKASAAKAEIDKAHRAGDLAVAYWLLTSPAKFTGLLRGKPEVVKSDRLAATIEEARKAYAAAAAEADALDVRIQAGTKALKADVELLAERKKSLEARIVQKLSAIKVAPPPPAQPAGPDAI